MYAIEAANDMVVPDPINTGKEYHIPVNSGEAVFLTV
jgi:hypothetical protein